MKNVQVTDKAIGGINIVPVIGVTLVILIIQLVLSPLLNTPNLSVNLPEAMTKETKDANVTISLSLEGNISVDNREVTWKKIPNALRYALRGKDDVAVVIRADKDLPYGIVESLMRTVNRHAGRHPVAVATQQRAIPLKGMAP